MLNQDDKVELVRAIEEANLSEDKLKIAGKDFSSRLLVGTGKYKNEQVAVKAIEASGAENSYCCN